MAEKFKTFDLWDPTVEDFDAMTLARVMEIRRRWTDAHSWGIVRSNAYFPNVSVPVSAINRTPNPKAIISQFPISLDLATGFITVAAGSNDAVNPAVASVAFDVNGDRIAITKDAAFGTTVTPYGAGNSGNLGIGLTLANDNVPVVGVYYVWMEYLEINDPASSVAEDGSVHYPVIRDGYRIILTGTAAAPNGDGISLFLGKIQWFGGAGVISVTDGYVTDDPLTNNNFIDTNPATDTAGDPARVFAGVKANQVEIQIDLTQKTLVYTDKMIASLQAHIMATGTAGAVTPENPHGQVVKDFPGGGTEPQAAANQDASLAKGLVDLNVDQNSPQQVAVAGRPNTEPTALAPATLDPVAVAAGIDPNTVKDAWVRVKSLDSTGLSLRAAFVSGTKLISLYPTLAQTTSPGPSTDPGDGWVGFANSDTVGVYRIYGSFATVASGDVLLLNKELLTGWPSVIDPLADDRLLFGQVYWDGLDLYQNPLKVAGVGMDDQRSIGLVGPHQLSSELKADPDNGGLARQTFINQVANSNYALGLLNVTAVGLNDTTAVVPNSTTPPTAIDSGTDSSLKTGPGAISGMRFTTNAGALSTLAASSLFHLLGNLKPGRYYGLSFWYKADPLFNVRTRIGLADAASGSPTYLMNLDGGAVPLSPFDFTVRNDNAWHRTSLVFRATSGVDCDPTVPKYLQFLFEQSGLATTAGTLTLTNIQLTEGEWIPGYAATGTPVPSGGNIFFDELSACPPGFELNENLQGRLPIGVVPGGSNGIQTFGTQLGTQITDGNSHVTGTAHAHSLDMGNIGVSTGADRDAAQSSPTGTTTPVEQIPLQVGVWCRAL